MKNILTFTALLFSFALFAQERTTDDLDYKYHQQGTHTINVGVGFPNLINSGFNIADQVGLEVNGGASPVFTIKHEYALTPEIGVGIHLGYFTAKTPKLEGITQYFDGSGNTITQIACELIPDLCTSETTGGGYDRYTVFTPGLRFAYHQPLLEQLDTYGSVVLGYNLINKKNKGGSGVDLTQYTNQIPTIAYFTGAGVRYYFSPQLAVYGEVGYGALTLVNVGATYRIQ